MGQLYVDTDGVSQPYATLADALASLSGSFTEDWAIDCYASTGVADTTMPGTLTFNTTSGHRLTITGHAGYAFKPNGSEKWTMAPSSNTYYGNIIIRGVAFEKTGMTANYQAILQVSTYRNGQIRLLGNTFLGQDVGGTYRDRLIDINIDPAYSATLVIANNVIIGRSTSASTANNLIYSTLAGNAYIYANTLKGYMSNNANANAVWKDNVIKTTYASAAVNAESDYNMFSGAFTFGGTNDEQGRTFVFVDEAGFDFHLDPSDTGAQDAGVSLASDAHYALTDDYDGVTRGDPPDAGAFEVVVNNSVVLSPISVIATPGALAVEQASNEVSLSPCSIVVSPAALTVAQATPSVLIDHASVAKFDIIPASYRAQILAASKWLSFCGESHSRAFENGFPLLSAAYPEWPVTVRAEADGAPEMPSAGHVRSCRAWRGPASWKYGFGEEHCYTNAAGIAGTKAHFAYCDSHGYQLDIWVFGWCYDTTWHNDPTATKDEVYGCGWAGSSVSGPEGDLSWGLDAADTAITGNTVCLDTYLAAIQEYINYCAANGIATRICYSTGPIDSESGTENGYQRQLKYDRIRDFVAANGGFLFDAADILAYDNAGVENSVLWTGNPGKYMQIIAPDNMLDLDGSYTEDGDHIGERGALRLCKAGIVLLAYDLGWDGEPEQNAVQLSPASIIASPAALTVDQVPPQSVSLSPGSVVVTPSSLAIGQLVPQPVSLSPASILATPGALDIGQSEPQNVSLSPASVIATPAALAIYQGIPPGLIDITISEGPRLLVKVIEGGVTMDSASPIMLEAVEERGTKSITLSFAYESAGVEVAFVPKTATWSLYNVNEAVVNEREDEPISSIAASITIVLSGLDLDASVNDEIRRLVIKGTYDSALGTDLPFVKEVQFHIIKIAGQ